MGEYAEDAIRRMHGHGIANDYARSQGRAPYWPDNDRNGRVTAPVRRKRVAKVFGSRYAGECPICETGWGAGDPIWYTFSEDGEEVLAHAHCGKERGGRGDIGFRPRSRREVEEEGEEPDDRPAALSGASSVADLLAGPGEFSEGGGRVKAVQGPGLAAEALARLRAARVAEGRRTVSAEPLLEEDEVLFE